MTEIYSLEDVAEFNERSLQRLERAITLSKEQFSLILVCCNSAPLRREMVKGVSAPSYGNIETLILSPCVETLYTTIELSLPSQKPNALMVFGLESVVAIDRLLTSTNFVRDDFRKNFAFPVVLWVNDEIMQKLIRLAPDFKSWASSTIRLHAAPDFGEKSQQLVCQWA